MLLDALHSYHQSCHILNQNIIPCDKQLFFLLLLSVFAIVDTRVFHIHRGLFLDRCLIFLSGGWLVPTYTTLRYFLHRRL